MHIEFHDIAFTCPLCGGHELVALIDKGVCHRGVSALGVDPETNKVVDFDWDYEDFYSASDASARFKCGNPTCDTTWRNMNELLQSGAVAATFNTPATKTTL